MRSRAPSAALVPILSPANRPDPTCSAVQVHRLSNLRAGDSVEIVEIGMIEADELPPDWSWCTTNVSLSERSGDVRGLSGTFESPDCDCGGSVALGNDPAN